MRELNPDFSQHVRNEATTLCRCWIIRAGDGSYLGFTDHDEDIHLNGVLCERHAGMETSAIEERTGLDSNSAEVSGALVSDYISEERIASGFFDKARVSTYLVNWCEPSEHFLDQMMLVGDITLDDGVYRMELRGLFSELEQTQGRHFVKRCEADLGDARCRLNLDTPVYSGTGTVIGSSGKTALTAQGLSDFESGWFSGGQLVWNIGGNAGQSIQILDHSTDGAESSLTLWQPTTRPVQVGDIFTITAGCAKDFGTCKAKFQNQLNFQGFPHMPGNSFTVDHANNSGTNNGAPIVP